MFFEDVMDGLEVEIGMVEVFVFFNLIGLLLVFLVEVCMDMFKVVFIKRFGVEVFFGEFVFEVSDIEWIGMIENLMFLVCLEFMFMEVEICLWVDEKLKFFLFMFWDEMWFVMVFLKIIVEVMLWCIFIEDEV